MEVVIDPDPVRQMVKIYVLGPRDGTFYAWNPKSESHTYVDVEPGEQPPFFIMLPERIFKAIMDKGVEYRTPNHATNRHLEDTIEVRDRLLTLVEQFAAVPRMIDHG